LLKPVGVTGTEGVIQTAVPGGLGAGAAYEGDPVIDDGVEDVIVDDEVNSEEFVEVVEPEAAYEEIVDEEGEAAFDTAAADPDGKDLEVS